MGAEALGGAEPVRIEPTGRPDRGAVRGWGGWERRSEAWRGQSVQGLEGWLAGDETQRRASEKIERNNTYEVLNSTELDVNNKDSVNTDILKRLDNRFIIMSLFWLQIEVR